jgi:hypothetical protein
MKMVSFYSDGASSSASRNLQYMCKSERLNFYFARIHSLKLMNFIDFDLYFIPNGLLCLSDTSGPISQPFFAIHEKPVGYKMKVKINLRNRNPLSKFKKKIITYPRP